MRHARPDRGLTGSGLVPCSVANLWPLPTARGPHFPKTMNARGARPPPVGPVAPAPHAASGGGGEGQCVGMAWTTRGHGSTTASPRGPTSFPYKPTEQPTPKLLHPERGAACAAQMEGGLPTATMKEGRGLMTPTIFFKNDKRETSRPQGA
jgi:hypothetical protein